MNATLEILEVHPEEIHFRIDGRIHVVPYVIQGTTVSFVFDGETYAIDVNDKGARAKARHRDHSAAAPMPGVVLKILVQEGEVVAKGTPLVVLEAMKMEHQIVAPHDGIVASIRCVEGDMVQPGFDLISMKER